MAPPLVPLLAGIGVKLAKYALIGGAIGSGMGLIRALGERKPEKAPEYIAKYAIAGATGLGVGGAGATILGRALKSFGLRGTLSLAKSALSSGLKTGVGAKLAKVVSKVGGMVAKLTKPVVSAFKKVMSGKVGSIIKKISPVAWFIPWDKVGKKSYEVAKKIGGIAKPNMSKTSLIKNATNWLRRNWKAPMIGVLGVAGLASYLSRKTPKLSVPSPVERARITVKHIRDTIDKVAPAGVPRRPIGLPKEVIAKYVGVPIEEYKRRRALWEKEYRYIDCCSRKRRKPEQTRELTKKSSSIIKEIITKPIVIIQKVRDWIRGGIEAMAQAPKRLAETVTAPLRPMVPITRNLLLLGGIILAGYLIYKIAKRK